MIYIQSNDNKQPHHFDCSCAMFGAIESCLDVRLTTYEEVCSGKFDLLIKNHLFVGSVEFMREVFSRIGKHDVRLPRNSNRESTIMTLGEALDIKKKIFIKPIEIKLFTGLILDGSQYTCLDGLDKNTKVLTYEIFESPIISEWRIYVSDNEISDSRNYSGDFMISPNYDYVKNVIKENNNFPVSYTIDIGILENSENVVVEFNDMWAIGNYGVPNYFYLKMLRNRYFEIIKS